MDGWTRATTRDDEFAKSLLLFVHFHLHLLVLLVVTTKLTFVPPLQRSKRAIRLGGSPPSAMS
jgi:hypothetical protein